MWSEIWRDYVNDKNNLLIIQYGGYNNGKVADRASQIFSEDSG